MFSQALILLRPTRWQNVAKESFFFWVWNFCDNSRDTISVKSIFHFNKLLTLRELATFWNSKINFNFTWDLEHDNPFLLTFISKVRFYLYSTLMFTALIRNGFFQDYLLNFSVFTAEEVVLEQCPGGTRLISPQHESSMHEVNFANALAWYSSSLICSKQTFRIKNKAADVGHYPQAAWSFPQKRSKFFQQHFGCKMLRKFPGRFASLEDFS